MIKVNENVINLVEKVRRAIKNEKITAENFPMAELCNLIECTMGNSFWDCIGSRSNFGFQEMPEIYKEALQDAVDRQDMAGCERVLRLFESSYKALYTAMGEDEKIFRQGPYRKMIIDLGIENAKVQYRLHQERQKAFPKEKEVSLGEGKGVVYTCLIGEKKLEQPKKVSARVDYICFTDQQDKWGTKEGVWEYRAIENPEDLSDEVLEYKYKIMAHKLLADYDFSIWIKSNMVIVGDIFRFCKIYGEGNGFLSFPQVVEDCIYQSMSITHMLKDDFNIAIRKRVNQYQKEGYPEHNGLIDDRVMVRSHRDDRLCKVMEAWWDEICEGKLLGANLFNYIAWKQQYPFSICDLFIYENIYFNNSEIDLETNDD